MSSSIPLRRSARLAAKGTGAPPAFAPIPPPWKAWCNFCDRLRVLMRWSYVSTKFSYTEVLTFAGHLRQKKGLEGWTDEAILAALDEWLPTRCLISGNQPIYDALVKKQRDAYTSAWRDAYTSPMEFVRTTPARLIRPWDEGEYHFTEEDREKIGNGQSLQMIRRIVAIHRYPWRGER